MMSPTKTRAEELFERLEAGGCQEVQRLIEQRQAESLFLDFKRSENNGDGDKLLQKDRENLAKAISGFGNGDGGVIVWGVDCRKKPGKGDVAVGEFPIVNPQRFASLLTGAVSGCTVPPHPKVLNHPIEIGETPGGFVATFVAASESAPHQAVPRMLYYMRSGSDFQPVPHGILAGMFGRKPLPSLVFNPACDPFQLKGSHLCFSVQLCIRNEGPGVARHPYISARRTSTGGPCCKVALETLNDSNWCASQALGLFCTVVGTGNFLLPPGAMCTPMMVHVDLIPPFESAFTLDLTVGCDGCAPSLFSYHSEPGALTGAFVDALEGRGLETWGGRFKHWIPSRIMGVELKQDA